MLGYATLFIWSLMEIVRFCWVMSSNYSLNIIFVKWLMIEVQLGSLKDAVKELVTAKCHCNVSLKSVTARCHCEMSLWSVTARCHCKVSLQSVTAKCHREMSLYCLVSQRGVTARCHSVELQDEAIVKCHFEVSPKVPLESVTQQAVTVWQGPTGLVHLLAGAPVPIITV